MSTAKKIVEDLSGLVGSLNELLQTEMARQAPDLAVELGAESQFNQAINFLLGLLEQIKTAVVNIRAPLLHIDALSGLVGLTRSFLAAVEPLVGASGEQLRRAGLGEVVQVTEPISEAVSLGSEALKSGQQVLESVPSVMELDELLGGIDDMSSTLTRLKAVTS